MKNEDDALDIVQETIYKAFISIKKLKETQYFSTWLTKILINNAIDFIKKNKRTITINNIDNLQENKKYSIEESIDLFNAIDRLGEPYKSVVILKYYKDLTIKQISSILKCPQGTIKSNLHRAIKKLKLNLREEGEG